ncbi:NAD(P)H dehydrogenase (quinone) [Streptomyces griseoloalbus]
MEYVTRIVIIGGGPGGYEAALVAAQLGAEVTVVDCDGLGGASVLTDCVPSKTLIATAEVMTTFDSSYEELGIIVADDTPPMEQAARVVGVDLGKVNRRVKRLALAQSHDITASVTRAGARVMRGRGRLDGMQALDGSRKVVVTARAWAWRRPGCGCGSPGTSGPTRCRGPPLRVCTRPVTSRVCSLASVAAMQGRIAMYHFLGDAVAPLNLKTVSSNVFTDPEIATVGYSQADVDGGKIDARVVKLPLLRNPRAKMQGIRDGFVKIFCRPGTGIVVGGVVVAPRASELIHPISIAVDNNLTVEQIANAFTVYPSLSGSIAEVARQLHTRKAGAEA